MPKPSSSSGVSRKTVKNRVALLALLLVVTGSIAYPAPANWVIGKVNSITKLSIPQISLPFALGLDLQGGTQLEYKADLSRIDATEQSGAMEGVRDVIERRVNSKSPATKKHPHPGNRLRIIQIGAVAHRDLMSQFR